MLITINIPKPDSTFFRQGNNYHHNFLSTNILSAS